MENNKKFNVYQIIDGNLTSITVSSSCENP